ncbi:MAG TPA: hypothetical protein VE131_10955 [Terriglobales bacterium]|nr:hypothetical protein [Terriglobales bacterium]
MRRSLKFIPWILPFLGIVLGYGYAYVFFRGLLETWQFVGKPDENIVRIIGIKDGRNLLVATETGKFYLEDMVIVSKDYCAGHQVALASPSVRSLVPKAPRYL